ncbi:MAG: hypothetical protein ABJB40_01870 [Acidobacteriota bacterium]
MDGQILREVDQSIFYNFVLPGEYGEIRGLGERFSDINVSDAAGKKLAFKKISPGVFDAERYPWKWSYAIDLTPLKNPSAITHVSSISGGRGILMPDDLLPQERGKAASLKIQVPPGWNIYSTEPEIAPGEFNIANIEKAVFFIGQDWRTKDFASNGASIKLAFDGSWLFSDDEAATLVSEVFENYVKTFGVSPKNKYHVGLIKFPSGTSLGAWEGDTRGSTITIASSDMPFKSQSLQRLHEQLRHEIFHLWIPNGVNLSGHYDWFYEGFALYQSLKLGVSVNRIRFEDMLDTLSRAYDIDRLQSQKLSLIDASKNRWAGANTQVYARGMLIAFLCDLALLDKSKGRQSVADILRTLYDRHRPPNAMQDGNAAVLALFRLHSELIPIIDRNITGSESIDWSTYLKAAGLEAEVRDQLTNLKVTAKPTSRQKDLLDKLGYNSWRKLTSK